MKKITYIAVIILMNNLLTNTRAMAQDARSTQSYSNPLRLNPSIMGANTDMRFILGYRSQWNAIEKGYTTTSFTAMCPFFVSNGKGKLDVGLSAYSDKAGAFKTSDFALAIGYSKELAPNNTLCLTLLGGYAQKSLNTGALTYDNQYVLGSYNSTNLSKETTIIEKVGYADVGFGLMWIMNPSIDKSRLNAFMGVSGYHLNQPNQSLSGGTGKLPMLFSYQGGVKILGENKIDITPNARVKVQNGNVETAIGTYIDYNFSENGKLVVGAWYRRNDAIAFMLGFEHKSFTFGYSYDMVTSGLNSAVSGLNAHEITLSFKLSRLKKANIPSFGEGGDKNTPSVRSNPFSSF